MFEKITLISDYGVNIKLHQGTDTTNLMNMHLVMEDNSRNIVIEVEYVDLDIIKCRFLGEIIDNRFCPGIIKKPSVNSNIRLMTDEEIKMIIGIQKDDNFTFGISPFYNNQRVYAKVNDLFSNHLTILGNTGSGKSFGTTAVIQSLFKNPNLFPYKSNFILFDNNGEYISAFKELNKLNPNYNFRILTTNYQTNYEKLTIPAWLLSEDDLALLLGATTGNQITLIERMIKLARIFSLSDEMCGKYKNHLLAKAMLSIIYSNDLPTTKRNNIFALYNTCTTREFNMEAVVPGAGYTRKFRECFNIDKQGIFTESILITNYISSFVDNSLDDFETDKYNAYTLQDLEKALAFALLSENWLNNETTYGESINIKVKLHNLVISKNSQIFNYPVFTGLVEYINQIIVSNNRKYQIININLEDIDDHFAKVLVKIMCRLINEYAKKTPQRGAVPFNLLVEEAHRYIKTGEDIDLLGYNIFDRISKEGRKFGVLLTLISQRPVELSETVMSQCANFLIFKTTHPRDIEYITRMVPYITEEIIEKQKGLQPGYCLAFGQGFKVPLIIKVDLPNPVPTSSNVDLIDRWGSRRA